MRTRENSSHVPCRNRAESPVGLQVVIRWRVDAGASEPGSGPIMATRLHNLQRERKLAKRPLLVTAANKHGENGGERVRCVRRFGRVANCTARGKFGDLEGAVLAERLGVIERDVSVGRGLGTPSVHGGLRQPSVGHVVLRQVARRGGLEPEVDRFRRLVGKTILTRPTCRASTAGPKSSPPAPGRRRRPQVADGFGSRQQAGPVNSVNDPAPRMGVSRLSHEIEPKHVVRLFPARQTGFVKFASLADCLVVGKLTLGDPKSLIGRLRRFLEFTTFRVR